MKRYNPSTIPQLYLAKSIYLNNPDGVSDADMAVLLRCSRATACRYRTRLNVYETTPGKYSMRPTDADLVFAHIVLQRQTIEHGNPHRPR